MPKTGKMLIMREKFTGTVLKECIMIRCRVCEKQCIQKLTAPPPSKCPHCKSTIGFEKMEITAKDVPFININNAHKKIEF